MLDPLLRLIEDTGALHSRLILVTGGVKDDRSALLAELGMAKTAPVLNLGIQLSHRLLPLPWKQRPLHAAAKLRSLLDDACASGAPALLDRAEVLFGLGLQIDPLDAFKRLAHARTVVANWPGELRDGRLTYAPAQHAEHRDYPASGIVIYSIH